MAGRPAISCCSRYCSPMPFPARLLADGEEVLSESNQHWLALRDEIAYSLVWVVLWIVFVPWLDFSGDEWIAWALTVAWLVLVGYGAARWHSTELIATNKRIIFRRGPFTKSAHEMEVDELKNVETRQSAVQRLVGSGDLLFELGGGGGKTVVRDIPDPIHVSSVVADEEFAAEKARLLGSH